MALRTRHTARALRPAGLGHRSSDLPVPGLQTERPLAEAGGGWWRSTEHPRASVPSLVLMTPARDSAQCEPQPGPALSLCFWKEGPSPCSFLSTNPIVPMSPRERRAMLLSVAVTSGSEAF